MQKIGACKMNRQVKTSCQPEFSLQDLYFRKGEPISTVVFQPLHEKCSSAIASSVWYLDPFWSLTGVSPYRCFQNHTHASRPWLVTFPMATILVLPPLTPVKGFLGPLPLWTISLMVLADIEKIKQCSLLILTISKLRPSVSEHFCFMLAHSEGYENTDSLAVPHSLNLTQNANSKTLYFCFGLLSCQALI